MGYHCLQYPVTPSIDPWHHMAAQHMSMTTSNHMCCHLCNGSLEPFFNKTALSLTLQGGYKTVSALLLHFLGFPIPRFISNGAYLGSFGTVSWASHEFERNRGKVTANMERNVLRQHTEPVCLNARSYRIVHSR
ncbi:uncharacterized protein TNCV_2513161 [Trichonephila clavipes]|nr:uncharacterized protein TNCV_2513161 [Trichonephila clavipes]